MSIALRSQSKAGSGSIGQTSLACAKPAGLAAGDLLIAAVGAIEGSRGWSAIIGAPSGGGTFIPAFDDGFAFANNYVIDDGSSARDFFWIGYRFATSTDVAATNYTVPFTGSPLGPSSTDFYMFALSGVQAAVGTKGLDHHIAIGSSAYGMPTVVDGAGANITGKTAGKSIGSWANGVAFGRVFSALDGSTEVLYVAMGSAFLGGYSVVAGTGTTAMASPTTTAYYGGGLLKGSSSVSGPVGPRFGHVFPLT